MVMEESAITGHGGHSPSGGDGGNSTGGGATNVYLVGLEFVRQYYTVLNQVCHRNSGRVVDIYKVVGKV